MELPFIARDKLLHAVAGSIAALVGALIALCFAQPLAHGAMLAALVAAVGKEAHDLATKDGAPEFADVSATIAGALPVILTALLA